ncbi:MAG: hypothetical protein WCB46_00100 [Methanoregula sp.]
MGKGKRVPGGHRGGAIRDRHAARGSNDERLDQKEPEEDPLHDLRPVDEEPELAYPDGDEYIWPEMQDETEEDD